MSCEAAGIFLFLPSAPIRLLCTVTRTASDALNYSVFMIRCHASPPKVKTLPLRLNEDKKDISQLFGWRPCGVAALQHKVKTLSVVRNPTKHRRRPAELRRSIISSDNQRSHTVCRLLGSRPEDAAETVNVAPPLMQQLRQTKWESYWRGISQTLLWF